MNGKFLIRRLDHGRESQVAPDPKYPAGIDLDISAGRSPVCSTQLPYPARRCGGYQVECTVCGLTVFVTTAGRPDDPRSLRMACSLAGLHAADDAY